MKKRQKHVDMNEVKYFSFFFSAFMTFFWEKMQKKAHTKNSIAVVFLFDDFLPAFFKLLSFSFCFKKNVLEQCVFHIKNIIKK